MSHAIYFLSTDWQEYIFVWYHHCWAVGHYFLDEQVRELSIVFFVNTVLLTVVSCHVIVNSIVLGCPLSHSLVQIHGLADGRNESIIGR